MQAFSIKKAMELVSINIKMIATIKEPLQKELFNILACPICKSSLNYNPKKTRLICTKCSEIYEIIDEIPILLPKK